LQLGSPDHALELWFASRMTARDVDPYLDTLYSAFEMLESGITTVQHLHGWRIGPAARVIGVAERILKAYEDIGMRVSYSYALRDQNRLAYEADEAFARRFPAPVSDELAAYLKAQAIPIDDHHGIFTDLWEKCGRNTRDRARIQLAPANLHWCSDEALEALRDWSAKYQVGMHMHLVETAYHWLNETDMAADRPPVPRAPDRGGRCRRAARQDSGGGHGHGRGRGGGA
jgi:cytosine/adenosine deaminase-related metal-dependent hydrolase